MVQTPDKDKQIPDEVVTPHSTEAADTVDLNTQLDRVTSALLVPGSNPVAELQKLDAAYAEAGESATVLVETTARRLFQQPGIFENLNFQSSIITGGSSFFGMVIRRMGELAAAEPELAEGAALPVRIRLVEQHRRGGDFEQMEEFARQVTDAIAQNVEANEPLALAQLAKVRYEQSMGAFAAKDFDTAIARAEESVDLCKRANDLFGVLAARGNIAGLFAYNKADAMGTEDPQYTEVLTSGVDTLTKDAALAREQREATDDRSVQQSYWRVEMNNALHLMQIAKRTDNLELARVAWAQLNSNPVFDTARDQEFALQYPQILEELEQKHA